MTTSTKTIALKTIHNDIVTANPRSTLTTKAMRVKLRAKMKATHEHNASWTFSKAEYDKVRSMFDPAYAAKIAKPARAQKVKAPKADAPVEA